MSTSGYPGCYGCGCRPKSAVSKSFNFRDAAGAKVTAKRWFCQHCMARFWSSGIGTDDATFAEHIEEKVRKEVVPFFSLKR